MPKGDKTKRVSGVDLSMKSFLYVGDADDTSSWLLPVYIPGDPNRTINLLRTHLGRFNEMKLPQEAKHDLLIALVGACKAHGITVDHAKAIELSAEENGYAREEMREGSNYVHGL
jgi:hypothetical protein